jgi:hypothetical protein
LHKASVTLQLLFSDPQLVSLVFQLSSQKLNVSLSLLSGPFGMGRFLCPSDFEPFLFCTQELQVSSEHFRIPSHSLKVCFQDFDGLGHSGLLGRDACFLLLGPLKFVCLVRKCTT